VITGLIKGNFPGRIAFAVAQRIDSQIIIDRTGAQQLISRGDMLFQIDGELTRLQCPFVDTPDIVRISDFIKEQEDNDRDINHEEPYMLPEYVGKDEGGSGDANVGNVKDRDPLFEEAVRFVVMGNTASTSSLQRRYEIGYNRAAAMGVMANIKYESSYNPNCNGDGGTSYGICQWHAGRKNNLICYCDEYGLDYTTLEGQLRFLKYELASRYPAVHSYLKNVDNTADGAYDAGYYFCFNFEAPAARTSQSTKRATYAMETLFVKK
jgi:hypothetical protein